MNNNGNGAVDPKLLAEWFWTDRWMGSRGFMLPLEPRGLYREMLTQAWRRATRIGRPELPNSPEAIRRCTGATMQEWRRSWPIVKKFWRVDGHWLVNDTQLEVYAECKARQESMTNRAIKAAAARWASHA